MEEHALPDLGAKSSIMSGRLRVVITTNVLHIKAPRLNWEIFSDGAQPSPTGAWAGGLLAPADANLDCLVANFC